MSRPHYLSLSLVLIVIGVFFPVCGFDFLSYDDNVNIYSNGLVSHPTVGSLLQFWTAPYEGLYIPLTYTLWALLAKLAALLPPTDTNHLNPTLFHAANLLVHALSALVLFRILRLLLDNDWAAAAGSLLFAVHPVQVEAVAWATGMKDLLSGLFSLLFLWQYLLSLGTAAHPLKGKNFSFILACAFFIAAMLAKPGAVVLPLVAGLLGHLLMKRTIQQLLPTIVPLLLLAIPVVIVTKLAQADTNQDVVPAIWQRFCIAGDALSFYLSKLLLPIGLGPDYGRTPAYVLGSDRGYVTGLIPYLLTGVGLWRFRHPWLLATAGVFVVVLLPVLGLTPFAFQAISTVADRYLYLALLGPALGVGWLLQRFQSLAVRIGAAVVLLLLAAQSIATVPHWRDSFTIAPQALSVNPRSWIVHDIVATAEIDRKHYDEAVAAGQKTIAANPKYGTAYFNLGVALEKLKRNDDAIAAYRKALELKPAFLPAYNSLAALYVALGRGDEAGVFFQQAMAISASKSGSGMGGGGTESRAKLANTRGLLYASQNQIGQAIEAYRQAVAEAPSFSEAYNNLGNAYLAANRLPEAMAAYQQAVKLNKGMAAFHSNLCNVYNLIGRNEEALASCRMALDLDPRSADSYLNLGNVMLAFNKTNDAIAAYRKTLELSPKSEVAAINLGMVYQAQGNNSEAMTYYRRAVEIRPDYVEAHDALGRLYQQLNMTLEAEAEFSKVRELAPNFGTRP